MHPGGTDFQTSMNRIYRALLVVLAFEMGALLLYLPWTVYWEQNYFLSHYPSLIRIVVHPSFRVAVSGVVVLDILFAIGWMCSRPVPDRARPQFLILLIEPPL